MSRASPQLPRPACHPCPLTLGHALLQDTAGLERLSQLLLHGLRGIELARGCGPRGLQLKAQSQAAVLRGRAQVLRRRGLLARCGRDWRRLGPDRGGWRQAETDLGAESGAVNKGERGGWRAAGQALRQLTCRSLRAPPRRFARPFPRPGLQFGCSGLSDRGLRLRSRPGSGTGAPGSGARGSGGGPGAATAASPSPDFSSDSSQPIILERLRGTWSLGAEAHGRRLTGRGPGTSSPQPHPVIAPGNR